jgi:hypothetical protein
MPSDGRRPFYRRGWFIAAAVVVVIPIIAIAWYLGSPLFINKTVVEAFPVATTAAPADADAPAAPATEAQEPPAADATQDTAQDTATSPGASERATADQAVGDSEEPAGDEPVATPTGPVAVLSGSFVGADSRHQGSGTATIYELEDGSRILRFENLDVTNGPDLHVIVSPVSEPETREDVSTAGYIDLGSLKGNRGDQNYEIPADFDLSQAGSIVIYCQPFHVIFATATLGQA